MRVKQGVRVGLVICLVAAGVSAAQPTAAAPMSPTAATAASEDTAPPAERPSAAPADPRSSDDNAAAIADAPPTSKLAPELASRARSERVQQVTVEVFGDGDAVSAAVAAAGGSLGRGGGGMYLATVGSDQLGRLAAAAGVSRVREPVTVPRVDTAPLTEGARAGSPETVADWGGSFPDWSAAGQTGQGSKVGIIALFDVSKLDTQVAGGVVVPVPLSQRKCVSNGAACPFGTPGVTYGNVLAELVSDYAPSTSLYLAELGSLNDYYPIIDWFAANGVQILVNPEVFPYDGPGNGKGPAGAVVDYAVAKGITWLNTSGEMAPTHPNQQYSGGYWRGTWSDPDADNWQNFAGSDESMTVYCGWLMGLRWSDWSGVMTDYDLYISDYFAAAGSNGVKLLYSGNSQIVAGAVPLEGNTMFRLCNTDKTRGPVFDTNKDGFVSLWVKRNTRSKASPVGDILEIGTWYGYLERPVGSGSVTMPFADSANAGAATVGDSYWHGESWPRTSLGPTNDGRTKPDVLFTGCANTSLTPKLDYDMACENSGFYGGDVAAARIAGLIAVARASVGLVVPRDVVTWLRGNGYAPGGPNRSDGGGLFRLPTRPPAEFPATFFAGLATPVRKIDTRAATLAGVTSAGALPPNTTVTGYFGFPTAVVLNVTVVKATNSGYLSVFPHGWSYPGAASTINVSAGQTRANMVIVPSGSEGHIDFFTSGGGDLLVDVLGYMAPSASDDAIDVGPNSVGRLIPMEPLRALDSRTCVGLSPCTAAPLGNDRFVDLDVRAVIEPTTGAAAIPASASGVAVQVTVDSPTAGGFASVIPGGQTAVPTSSVNFEAGKSATAMAWVRTDGAANGRLRVFLKSNAHLQVDILGYFTSSADTYQPIGTYVPLMPRRLIDTRPPNSKPAAVAPLVVSTSGSPVPSNALAVMVNTTAIHSEASGSVRVSATGSAPTRAFTNLTVSSPGPAIASATITLLDHGNFVMQPTMATNLLSDVMGYFQRQPPPAPPGAVSLITRGWDGSAANGPSTLLGISDDGERVLFWTEATNLEPTARAGYSLYVWNKSSDSVEYVPLLPGNISTLSPDGLHVVGWTYGAFDAADLDTAVDVYSYSLVDHTYTFLSNFPATVIANGVPSVDDTMTHLMTDGLVWNLSTGTTVNCRTTTGPGFLTPDGSKVISMDFPTGDRLVRICDTTTGAVTYFAPTIDGHPATLNSAVLDLSPDGSSVAVRLDDAGWSVDLATGDSTPLFTDDPRTPDFMQFSNDEQRVLMAGLYRDDWVFCVDTGVTLRFDATTSGLNPNAWASQSLISGDGQFVVFRSAATNMLETPTTGTQLFITDLSMLPQG